MNVLLSHTLASLAADLDAARADLALAEAAVERAVRLRNKLQERARDTRRALDEALGVRPGSFDDILRSAFPR